MSHVCAVLRLGVWLLLLSAALHLLRLGLRAFLTSPGPLPQEGEVPRAGAELPVVTVQLPLRDEALVAERVVRAGAALSWPADRLEVQVLDDSGPGDPTAAIVDRVAAELRAQGHDVRVLRRPAPRLGFKGGNLQHGLQHARGDFLAVLDADSVPPPDLLLRLVPPLLDTPDLAFTQARWSFDNEDRSLLTRVQALILHGLMLVEQPALSQAGLPLSFNGTAGVWRKAALLQAGGWYRGGAGALTEDMDLSCRARLCGLRGLHLPQVAVQTELPATMAAFRRQQQRWVRGGAEVLRSQLARLLHGDGLGPAERGVLLGHLLRHMRQPLLASLPLWLPATLLGRVAIPPHPMTWTALLAFLWLALFLYYGAALRRLGRSPWPALSLAPALCALSVGMAPALSQAFLAGLAGRPGDFVRTPKTGGAADGAMGIPRDPNHDPLPLIETLLGLLHCGLAVALLARGQVLAALACGALVGGGLLWTGLGTMARRG